MEEETTKFLNERAERNADLLARQAKEQERFDLQTTTMGLDAMHIMEATQDSYQDDDNLDTDSVRGSMLSLTPSSSTNSFLPGGSGGAAAGSSASGGTAAGGSGANHGGARSSSAQQHSHTAL